VDPGEQQLGGEVEVVEADQGDPGRQHGAYAEAGDAVAGQYRGRRAGVASMAAKAWAASSGSRRPCLTIAGSSAIPAAASAER
jgi:hypothetical protein